jgi:hypothetical protein
VAEVAGLADAVAALRQHARAVRLVARRHRVVAGWTVLRSAGRSKIFGLLRLARTCAEGNR